MMDIRALGYILVEATDTERCQLGVRFCARSVMWRWASRAGCKQVAALYERRADLSSFGEFAATRSGRTLTIHIPTWTSGVHTSRLDIGSTYLAIRYCVSPMPEQGPGAAIKR